MRVTSGTGLLLVISFGSLASGPTFLPGNQPPRQHHFLEYQARLKEVYRPDGVLVNQFLVRALRLCSVLQEFESKSLSNHGSGGDNGILGSSVVSSTGVLSKGLKEFASITSMVMESNDECR